MNKILITGGAGYLGSKLVPELLKLGLEVNVLDLIIYGKDVLPKHHNLQIFKGDIRDKKIIVEALNEVETISHLACISNDPSFELNPKLGKSINLDAFEPMVKIARDLKEVFNKNILVRPLENEFYYNIKRMKNITLK